MRGCCNENRRGVFFWKLPGERAFDVLLEQMPKKTCDVWKKYNTTDSGQSQQIGSLVCLALLFNSFHITLALVCLGFLFVSLVVTS